MTRRTPGVDLATADDLLVVGDRLILREDMRERVADSIGTAFHEGEGEVVVVVLPDHRRIHFSERFHCPDHPGVKFLDPTPRLFSFNNPYGSCPTCTGFGATLEYDPELIVPNATRAEGRRRRPVGEAALQALPQQAAGFREGEGRPANVPWKDLPKAFRDEVIKGRRRSSRA
jgi:excinuclease ABC subunit A